MTSGLIKHLKEKLNVEASKLYPDVRVITIEEVIRSLVANNQKN